MRNEDLQVVTLMLAAEVFAIPVEHVREILEYRPPFAIPEAPAYFVGLTDVRGQAAPTIDLRRKLGLPPTSPDAATRILMLDVPVDGRILSLGLVADRVLEVATLSPSQMEAAPDIGVRWRSDYINCVCCTEKGFVVVLDLPRLLASEDVALIGEAEAA